jgi:predicted enzyme related to lactoylglutathione lyase
MKNVISWFQIPVTNFERAVKFYNTILAVDLLESRGMGAQVALFPHDMKNGAVGGALYHGPGFNPSCDGTVVMLNVGKDLALVLSRIEEAGGRISMSQTPINNNSGFLAYFIDTEGNRVGLYSKNELFAIS